MRRSIKLFSLSLVLVILLSIFAGCSGTPGTATASSAAPASSAAAASSAAPASSKAAEVNVPSVKIGCFYNLSGGGADTGNKALAGAQMAADQINAAGGIKSLGGAKIELVPADTMSDTAQSKSVADRILASDDIMAAIGVSGSAYGLPMLPSFEKAGCAFVHNGVSNQFTSQGYKTVFQICCNSTAFGQGQLNYIKFMNDKLGYKIKKFGSLYEDTDVGVSQSKTAKDAAVAAGYEWVYDQSFTLGALTDASSLVVAMKQSGVQVVFIAARDSDIKIIVNGMKSLNYMPMIFGNGAGFLIPSFATELGDAVDGILSVATASYQTKYSEQDQKLNTVAADFETKNKTYMTEHSVGAYTAVNVIAAALEKCGKRNRTEICNAIRSLELNTMMGKIKFDETGRNVNAQCLVIQWQKCKDGIFRPNCIYPDDYAPYKLQTEKLAVK